MNSSNALTNLLLLAIVGVGGFLTYKHFEKDESNAESMVKSGISQVQKMVGNAGSSPEEFINQLPAEIQKMLPSNSDEMTPDQFARMFESKLAEMEKNGFDFEGAMEEFERGFNESVEAWQQQMLQIQQAQNQYQPTYPQGGYYQNNGGW